MGKLSDAATGFGLTAILMLTSCASDPYSTEPDIDDTRPIIGNNITARTILNSSITKDLDSGIYIFGIPALAANSEDNTYLLVIKDDPYGEYRGYFGITSIDDRFVPEREPDSSSEEIKNWTIQRGNIANSLKNGISRITINGALLNGTDLSLTIIKDAPMFDYEGYFGIQANMPALE